MRASSFPATVLPTHGDNYFVPFDAPQEASIQQLQAFTREVRASSPTHVIVPKYFLPVVLESRKHRN
jgi:hypothetical protein